MMGVLVSGFVGFGWEVLQGLIKSLRSIRTKQDLMYWLMFVGVSGIAFFGRSSYKAITTYIKYRDIAKDFHQIGKALLVSLTHLKIIRNDPNSLNIISSLDHDGGIYCHLKG